MASNRNVKFVVVGVLYRRRGQLTQVLTQKRLVQNKAYDPLYDQTWEAVGETVEEGETVMEALIRGVREECGTESALRVEDNDHALAYTTGKNDLVVVTTPLCFLESMGPPQPWVGPAFPVEVPEDFEPDRSKSDGEAGEAKWWTPEDLLEAIHAKPNLFMGLHLPALKLAAERLKRK